ncbi:MAG: zinc ribbon domain-containing protein [Peptococcaceae bacterium]|nr:zinc ribbon domain-containing protein [Peptococcaceae bacterium]
MAFFDDLGKKITQTGQGVAQKTRNVADTVKLNSMISDEKKNVDRAYFQIGKAYFEAYGNNNPDQLFDQMIDGINDSNAKIATYTEQIKQIKGVVPCPKCGTEVPYNAPFCSSCGGTMNVASASEQSADGAVCGVCGAQVTHDKAFCTSCGNKITPAEEVSTPAPVVKTVPPEAVQVESSNVDATVATPSFESQERTETSSGEAKKCPTCGSEMASHVMFCLNCGQKVDG